jgi:RNA polymerase subunit RPABC4/transcription elongation factor Spt4
MTKKRVVSKSTRVDKDKVGDRQSAGTKRVYKGTVEAEWTCSSCGREHIPGGVKKCPSCGNPKGEDEVYETPETPGRFLTEQELEERGVDPHLHLSDELCPYCGSKLKPGTQKCPNCGASLTDVGYTTRVCPACERETNEMTCPNCGTPTVPKDQVQAQVATAPSSGAVAEAPPASAADAKPKQPIWQNRSAMIVIGAGALICVLLACIMGWLFFPRTEVATVSDLSWERTIAIQEHQYNLHEDWSLPDGADLESTEERIHHYDEVLKGYKEECGYEESCTSVSVYDHTETTCYDDGTCDEEDVYRTEEECTEEYVCEDVPQYEDVPVYQTWYNYYIWEWVDIEPAVASGHDADPYWPEITLEDNQREKSNGREETCTVTFVNQKEKTYDFSVSCSELEKYDIGSHWEIERNASRVTEANPVR